LAAYLDIGLIDSPGATSGSAKAVLALHELRYVPPDRPQDRRVGKIESAFRHNLDQIAEAELVTQVPAHARDNHFTVKVPSYK